MFDIVSGALRVSLVTFVLCGFAYPFAVTVLGQLLTPSGAWQSRDKRRRRGSWLAIDRAELDGPEVVPRPPIGDDRHRSERFDEDDSRTL